MSFGRKIDDTLLIRLQCFIAVYLHYNNLDCSAMLPEKRNAGSFNPALAESGLNRGYLLHDTM